MDPIEPAAPQPTTLAGLRASGWRPRTVKEELRANLLDRLGAGRGVFPGIIGYEETVVPAIENAILAGQDIVFLGERGQAKTRMARLLVGLLDPWLPVVRGGELNDDPSDADQPGGPGHRRRATATRRRSTGSRATAATPRSWRRPTSRSPTSSARWTRSRSPRAATCPTS